MRVLIFSDLHANWEALAALQQVETKPDALIFLGDAVGYGPDPVLCATWIKHHADFVVQGDHDQATALGTHCAASSEWQEIAHATRDMTRRLLSQGTLDYFAALPSTREIEIGDARFWLTHQGLNSLDPLTTSDATLARALEHTRANVVLFGHTHIPMLRKLKDTWIVNPGSLGQPCHGLPSATFAVWEDGNLKIQHIDYDPRPTMQKLALLPLDPEHILRLQETLERGM